MIIKYATHSFITQYYTRHGIIITITADCLNCFYSRLTVFKISMPPRSSSLRSENKCHFSVQLLILSNLFITLPPSVHQDTEQLSRSFCTPAISNTLMALSLRHAPSFCILPFEILFIHISSSACSFLFYFTHWHEWKPSYEMRAQVTEGFHSLNLTECYTYFCKKCYLPTWRFSLRLDALTWVKQVTCQKISDHIYRVSLLQLRC